MNQIIQRKVMRGRQSRDEAGPGADQGWRLSFARAVRERLNLFSKTESQRIERRSLAEVLELQPERALIALLDGPGGALGVLSLSPDIYSAFVEVQTIGRISPNAPRPRQPTRTDAVMVAPVIDLALAELENELAEEEDLAWAGGFRFASFVEDPRPLGLLLEDQSYRVLTSTLSLGAGDREGQMLLVLPAAGKGNKPRTVDGSSQFQSDFSQNLSEAVMAVETKVDAIIARVVMPLGQLLNLAPGTIIGLPNAQLDHISLEGGDGARLGVAQLGQHQGMRALRLQTDSAGGHSDLPMAEAGMMLSAGFDMGAASAPSVDLAAENGGFEMPDPMMANPDFMAEAGFGMDLPEIDLSEDFLATG